MKNTLSIILVGLVLCTIALADGTLADDDSWTIFDPAIMKVYGIDGDNIVGEYGDIYNNKISGFIYDGTTLRTFNMPGSNITTAYDIDGTNIVGVYSNYHSFLYDGSTWSSLDFPGADTTSAYGIDSGNIVGTYHDISGWHGFLYDGSTWTTLDAPGSYETHAYGIDGKNIVGEFSDDSGYYSFLYDRTNWTILNVPDIATDIDGSNIIGISGHNSFLYNGTTCTTLDLSGLNGTYAWGIDGNRIVGYVSTPIESTLGFIYTIPEPATLILFGLGFTQILRRKGTKLTSETSGGLT